MKIFRRMMSKTVFTFHNIPICIRDLAFLAISLFTFCALGIMTFYYKGYLSSVTILYTFYSITFLLSSISCAVISKLLDLLTKRSMIPNMNIQPIVDILCYILLFLSLSFTFYTYEVYNTWFYIIEIILDGFISVLLLHFTIALIHILQIMPTLNTIYHQRGVQEC